MGFFGEFFGAMVETAVDSVKKTSSDYKKYQDSYSGMSKDELKSKFENASSTGEKMAISKLYKSKD